MSRKIAEKKSIQVKEYIKKYISSLRGLSVEIREKLKEDFPTAKIVDFKTFLLPFSDELNLFIVVDNIDFETEIKIGFALTGIERKYLKEKNTFCDILYAQKTPKLDVAAIKRDYPFSLKV